MWSAIFLHGSQEVTRTEISLRKPIGNSSCVWNIKCISRDARETSSLETVNLNTVETIKGTVLYRI